MIVALLCFHGTYLVSDVAFDRSSPSTKRFVIVDKKLTTEMRGVAHLLLLTPALDGSPEKFVDPVMWNRSRVGGAVCTYTYPGALSGAWQKLALCN